MKTGTEDKIGKEIGKESDSEDKIGKEIGKESDSEDKIGKKGRQLLKFISDNPNTSISNLARLSEMATSTVQVYLDKLRLAGKIRRVGPNKGGYWEVL